MNSLNLRKLIHPEKFRSANLPIDDLISERHQKQKKSRKPLPLKFTEKSIKNLPHIQVST